MMNNLFASRLAEAMRESGVTAADMARNIGISPQSVQQWLSGETMPRPNRLTKIAAIVGMTVTELMEVASKDDDLGVDPLTDILLQYSDAMRAHTEATKTAHAARRRARAAFEDYLTERLFEAGYEQPTMPGTTLNGRADILVEGGPDSACDKFALDTVLSTRMPGGDFLAELGRDVAVALHEEGMCHGLAVAVPVVPMDTVLIPSEILADEKHDDRLVRRIIFRKMSDGWSALLHNGPVDQEPIPLEKYTNVFDLATVFQH